MRRVKRCMPPSPGTMVLPADWTAEGAPRTVHGRRPRYFVIASGRHAGCRAHTAVWLVVAGGEFTEGAYPRHVIVVSGGHAGGRAHTTVPAHRHRWRARRRPRTHGGPGLLSQVESAPGDAHRRQPRGGVVIASGGAAGGPAQTAVPDRHRWWRVRRGRTARARRRRERRARRRPHTHGGPASSSPVESAPGSCVGGSPGAESSSSIR